MGVGVSIGTSAAVVACVMMALTTDAKSNFFHWGPDANVTFIGFEIRNWTRWWALMSYSLISQVAQSLVHSTLSPWMSNVVRDHKTPIPTGSYYTIQSVAVIYNVFGWVVSILDTFVWITCQLQYLLPALISDACITVLTTHRYIRAKHTAIT